AQLAGGGLGDLDVLSEHALRDRPLEGEAVRVARLAEQRLCLLRIVGVRLDAVAITQPAWPEGAWQHTAAAAEYGLHDGLAVDRSGTVRIVNRSGKALPSR